MVLTTQDRQHRSQERPKTANQAQEQTKTANIAPKSSPRAAKTANIGAKRSPRPPTQAAFPELIAGLARHCASRSPAIPDLIAGLARHCASQTVHRGPEEQPKTANRSETAQGHPQRAQTAAQDRPQRQQELPKTARRGVRRDLSQCSDNYTDKIASPTLSSSSSSFFLSASRLALATFSRASLLYRAVVHSPRTRLRARTRGCVAL